MDFEGCIHWANPAFYQLSQYIAEEILGENIDRLMSDQHCLQFYLEIWNTVLAGKVWNGEVVCRRKGGTHYPLEVTFTPIENGQGEIINIIAIHHDITSRKEGEKLLGARKKAVQNKRLVSLAAMVQGIAHEINQPLNSIKVSADSVLYWAKQGKHYSLSEMLEIFTDISQQCNRIDQIIRNIRFSLGREISSSLLPDDLKQAVQEFLSIIQREDF